MDRGSLLQVVPHQHRSLLGFPHELPKVDLHERNPLRFFSRETWCCSPAPERQVESPPLPTPTRPRLSRHQMSTLDLTWLENAQGFHQKKKACRGSLSRRLALSPCPWKTETTKSRLLSNCFPMAAWTHLPLSASTPGPRLSSRHGIPEPS